MKHQMLITFKAGDDMEVDMLLEKIKALTTVHEVTFVDQEDLIIPLPIQEQYIVAEALEYYGKGIGADFDAGKFDERQRTQAEEMIDRTAKLHRQFENAIEKREVSEFVQG